MLASVCCQNRLVRKATMVAKTAFIVGIGGQQYTNRLIMAMRSGSTMPSASPSTAGLGLPQMPLTAATGRVYAPYRPSGRHGVIDFGVKNRVVASWKSLFDASVKKARNGPSTQLIEAASCLERLNAKIKAKEHR